jgi:hypothetical protein
MAITSPHKLTGGVQVQLISFGVNDVKKTTLIIPRLSYHFWSLLYLFKPVWASSVAPMWLSFVVEYSEELRLS